MFLDRQLDLVAIYRASLAQWKCFFFKLWLVGSSTIKSIQSSFDRMKNDRHSTGLVAISVRSLCSRFGLRFDEIPWCDRLNNAVLFLLLWLLFFFLLHRRWGLAKLSSLLTDVNRKRQKKKWKKNEANNKTGRGKVERPQRGLVCFFFIKKKTKKKRARPSDRKMKLAGR